MPNITITNVDNGSVELEGGKFRDDTLVFAGTETVKKGTILARQLVGLVPTASAVQGGTGTGTLTVLSVPHATEVPIAGVWILRCVEAVSNGGIFRLEDPNGKIVATDLRMTAGSGGTTVIEVAGMQFTVTDATDFIVGNTFEITVAAVNKLVPFNPAGAGGAQFPLCVLTYEATRGSAGDLPVRPLRKGDVNKRRLIIHVDGNGNNITALHIDRLAQNGILAVDVSQLSKLDNQ